MDLSNPQPFDVSKLDDDDRLRMHYATIGVLMPTRVGALKKQPDGTVLHYPQPNIQQSVEPTNG